MLLSLSWLSPLHEHQARMRRRGFVKPGVTNSGKCTFTAFLSRPFGRSQIYWCRVERMHATYFSPSKQQLMMEKYEEVKHLIAYIKKGTQPLWLSLEKKPGRQCRKVRKILTDSNLQDQKLTSKMLLESKQHLFPTVVTQTTTYSWIF